MRLRRGWARCGRSSGRLWRLPGLMTLLMVAYYILMCSGSSRAVARLGRTSEGRKPPPSFMRSPAAIQPLESACDSARPARAIDVGPAASVDHVQLHQHVANVIDEHHASWPRPASERCEPRARLWRPLPQWPPAGLSRDRMIRRGRSGLLHRGSRWNDRYTARP